MSKCQEKTISPQKKHVKPQEYQPQPSTCGLRKEKLNVLELQEDIDASIERILMEVDTPITDQNETSVTQEYLHHNKRTIWRDRLSSLEIDTLITKLSLIQDLVSTSNEEGLKPFWTQQSRDLSERLWLPTKIDCVDSVLTSSMTSSQHTPMGASWFSINKKHPQTKNSLMTSFQSSQFSHHDYMVGEATQSKRKRKIKKTPEPKVKTLKIRLFPSDDEKEKLKMMFDQFRWYYNYTLSIVYHYYKVDELKGQLFFSKVRDLMRKYDYNEEVKDKIKDDGTTDTYIEKSYKYVEGKNEVFVPEWWKDKVHNRTPRGAVKKFVSAINSAISNKKAGHNDGFKMKFRSRRDPTEYYNSEDQSYPKFINNIKSNYWYRTKDRHRKNISFAEINNNERPVEIIHDKQTDKYYLHYPVDIGWFPEDDIRRDNQTKYVSKGERVISLDPGVRKFLVGYDPTGESVFIGEGASRELTILLLAIDKTPKDEKYKKWKRIKNLVDELHWKTISFLIENYDTIILPHFETSKMIKGRKLSRMTKRLLLQFSFYRFKEKLAWKCARHGKNLVMVDESYTSKTCGRCGNLNDVGGNEIYLCSDCNLIADRDVLASRNIFIKNTRTKPYA